jgi:AcrR family transcriptional regulator
VPRLWTETIETHRREVRDAILDTTAALVAEHGPWQVTMSQIATRTGIGRATLYKYFPDVESILLAWHERHVTGHLEQLARLADGPGSAGERLEAVLGAYAHIIYQRPRGTEVAALVHRGEHLARMQRRLAGLFRDLMAGAARVGQVRGDVPPAELARYCVHALTAAGELKSEAAVSRLVAVTLAGLRPPR